MIDAKRKELYVNDNYPDFHEIMGDIYSATGFTEESITEYKKALSQESYFTFPQTLLQINYKLADVYLKRKDYELADIIYREITAGLFKTKNQDYWERIRYNIEKDPSISHVFRIYRIDGIEYMKALYMIGKRSALLQRKKESIYYLTLASIIWMTYYDSLIKIYHFDFQYSGPADFIPYLKKKDIVGNIPPEDYLMDRIFFFIGYLYHISGDNDLQKYYFNLSLAFGIHEEKFSQIKKLIEYFDLNSAYKLQYDEIIN